MQIILVNTEWFINRHHLCSKLRIFYVSSGLCDEDVSNYRFKAQGLVLCTLFHSNRTIFNIASITSSCVFSFHILLLHCHSWSFSSWNSPSHTCPHNLQWGRPLKKFPGNWSSHLHMDKRQLSKSRIVVSQSRQKPLGTYLLHLIVT